MTASGLMAMISEIRHWESGCGDFEQAIVRSVLFVRATR